MILDNEEIPVGNSVKYTSSLANSLLQYTEVLTMHDSKLRDVNNRTLRIYSSLSGNEYLMRASVEDDSTLSLLRHEMEVFVEHRMIDTFLPIVSTLHTRIGALSYDTKLRIPVEIEILQSDVFSMCRPFTEYRPDKFKDEAITEMNLTNLYGMFNALRSRFMNICTDMKSSTADRVRNAEVLPTSRIITITSLIAKIAVALLIARHHLDEDYDKDQNELDQQYILAEFSSLSNLGSISMVNLVCCMSDIEYVRLAVDNTRDSLGYYEKLLLRNGLMMTKMSSLLNKQLS